MKCSNILVAIILLSTGALACEPVDIEQAETEGAATTAPTEALPVPMARVLVTSEQLDVGAEVTDDVIEVIEFPRKHLTDDMLAEEARGDIVGRKVVHAVPKGALIHQRDFDGVKASDEVEKALEPLVVTLADAERRVLADKASAALLAKGRQAYLGTLSIAPGAGVPQHRDPTEEFLYILEGGGTITINGTSHEIGPETAIFMPADAEVSFQNGDAQTRVLQVFAGPGPASKYDAWEVVEPVED